MSTTRWCVNATDDRAFGTKIKNRLKFRANGNLDLGSSRLTLYEHTQFMFRNYKLGNAATQANDEFWKYPHGGLINMFGSAEVNADLAPKIAHVLRAACLAVIRVRNPCIAVFRYGIAHLEMLRI